MLNIYHCVLPASLASEPDFSVSNNGLCDLLSSSSLLVSLAEGNPGDFEHILFPEVRNILDHLAHELNPNLIETIHTENDNDINCNCIFLVIRNLEVQVPPSLSNQMMYSPIVLIRSCHFGPMCNLTQRGVPTVLILPPGVVEREPMFYSTPTHNFNDSYSLYNALNRSVTGDESALGLLRWLRISRPVAHLLKIQFSCSSGLSANNEMDDSVEITSFNCIDCTINQDNTLSLFSQTDPDASMEISNAMLLLLYLSSPSFIHDNPQDYASLHCDQYSDSALRSLLNSITALFAPL